MKPHLTKKKLILLLLLLAAAVLAIARRGSYYEVREYYAMNVSEETYDLMSESAQEIRQTFTAKQSELEHVYLRFDIEDLVNLNGTLTLEIESADGETVRTGQKKLSSLTQTETATWTEFSMFCELEKGKEYTLVVRTSNVSGSGKCSLWLSRNRQFLFGDLNLNGTESPRRLEATFKYNTYCIDDLYKMLILLAFAALLVLLSGTGKLRRIRRPFRRLHRKPAALLFLLTPFASYFLMQTFCGYDLDDFLEQLFSLRGLLNVLIYSLILMVCFLITNRTKYAALLTVCLTWVLGLANYFVWDFRGCPIVAADLASLKTAANVAGNYSYAPGLDAVWATVLLVCWISVLTLPKTGRGLHAKRRLALLLAAASLTTGMWGVFFKSDLMKRLDITVSVWMPERDYAYNGCALSFLLTWTYYIVEKPEGYSIEAAEEIAADYVSDTEDTDTSGSTSGQPNIIAIMNESFSDLSVDCDLETTEDYMPFIHNLTENAVKGHLYVSVLGGNTANTEFEFLTGNSLAFFPTRSIPYNSYIKEETGSLTWTLKAQGYQGNLAVHPYYPDGWNREIVYPLLGFDGFLSQSDFVGETRVREFISDQSDFEKLIEEYEETRETTNEPFYTFSVTMQNHGGYSGTHGLTEETIQVTSPSGVDDQVTQYLNLIRLSDQAFEELTEYFADVDEPTVIVMFGDHQPGFTDSVYDDLMGQPTTTLDIADTSRMYQVPYVIWANYDIEEETLDMSANYLSSYLLSLTGSRMSGYNKYLLDLMEKLPVISATCYIGDDGIVREPDAESAYSDLIREYQILQYNNIFDVSNRLENFFFLQ